ncbi:deoxyguanosinetriphosphate triphosphohydrolase family protein [Candidatus Poriferisodalis sp.]|uniref:deoxyguanosinetriphosphate triphosphohydrolase family protein n=1 Tax=Candidatus Poriferisodalis sp. TaxID=3101277 RepID=UPI003B5A1C7E
MLYCDPFRRLLGVTQVVGAHEGLTFHNRLTHSMKVGQIARRLAEDTHRKFQPQQIDDLGGLDPEVAEAAALAHDIGHPPFGHATERTLDELVRNEGCHDGFEGNAQSFRVITKLAFTKADPDTPPGLDLTRATLRAVLKYPWLRDLDSNNHPKTDSDRSKKWSAYETELEDFEFAMELQPAAENRRSLEAEIMDWADDVTYAVHDLEDFYRANLIPLPTLIMDEDTGSEFLTEVCRERNLDSELAQQAFQNLKVLLPDTPFIGTAASIGRLSVMRSSLITTLLQAFEIDEDGEVMVQPEGRTLAEILKYLTRKYVIDAPSLNAQRYGHRRIITELFDAYCDIGSKSGPNSTPLNTPFFDRKFYLECHSARRAADFIASLTDDQAIRLYRRITGQSLDSIHLPIA